MESNRSIWRYIKHYKFNSILLKNFLVIMILIIFPLSGISLLVYHYNHAIIEQEIGRANLNTLSKVRDTVDMIIGEVERISLQLASDPDIETFLIYPKPKLLDYSNTERIHKIQQVLSITEISNQYIDSIQVYSYKNNYVITSKNAGDLYKYNDQWWYSNYVEQNNNEEAWFMKYINKKGYEFEQTTEYISKYRLAPLYGDYKGFVAININLTELGTLISREELDQEIFIVDEKKKIVYSKNSEEIEQYIYHIDSNYNKFLNQNISNRVIEHNGIKKVISITNSQFNKWKYISIVPLKSYEFKNKELMRFVFILGLLSIITAIILSLIIAVQGFQPIRRIITILEDKEEYDYLSNQSNTKLDEIKYIAMNIVNYWDRNKEMEDELEQRYKRLKKAQAIALQSQINPHFLFNSLEAINWKVMRMTNSKNEASTMIAALSKLLRLSLETEDNLITIEQEIEHANLYIQMQKLRYKEKFNVQWKIEDTITIYKTMKLILQPVIENAIYHGIKPSAYNGVITVNGWQQDKNIIFVIQDNGVGMSKDEIEYLNKMMNEDYIKQDKHIGLANVNQRIKIVFGPEYGLTIDSKKGEGTSVKIVLPLIT